MTIHVLNALVPFLWNVLGSVNIQRKIVYVWVNWLGQLLQFQGIDDQLTFDLLPKTYCDNSNKLIDNTKNRRLAFRNIFKKMIHTKISMNQRMYFLIWQIQTCQLIFMADNAISFQ